MPSHAYSEMSWTESDQYLQDGYGITGSSKSARLTEPNITSPYELLLSQQFSLSA
jgi:hypothetical protein